MLRKLFRLLLLTVISGASVLGQEPVYTLKVDVPWVTVDVTVTDRTGKNVTDLTLSDFQILENGVPQEIHAFAPATMPYNILLLFDRSGSTEHKWQFMLRAVARFHREPAGARSCCYRFFRFRVHARRGLDL